MKVDRLLSIATRVIFGCLFLLHSVSAQELRREQIISAYIFNFAKNIEWRSEDRISVFHFWIISEDKSFNHQILKLPKAATLRDKSIKVTISASPEIPKDVQLVYIARDKMALAASVFQSIEGRNMLLVTYGIEDKRIAMINLIETKDKTIKFEINKANIINQGLKVLPDMVLLGGTEIDVAKLYKESQDTLRIKDVKIADLQKHLESLRAQIETSLKEIEKQRELIEKQRELIEKKGRLIAQQDQAILEKQNQLARQRDTLSLQTNQLRETQLIFDQQQREIESGKAILSNQQSRIDSQNAAIQEQRKVLGEQVITIESQKEIQRFLILIILLALGLTYTLYRSYKSKQSANKQLQEQKDKLQESLGQLKIARDRAQQYLDIAGVILVAIDADRRITMINKKGCDVLGSSMDEILGKDWFETFIPASIRENTLRVYNQVIGEGAESIEYYENVVSTHGHGERLIAWHNSLLRNDDGKIIGTLSSGEDITEKKSAEKQIKILNQELLERAAALEAANKELEAFSYSVSHDLRAPLRSIDGFSLAIIEDYENALDERGKDYLRRVRSAAQRMAHLIDDMLNLSRVSRSEMVLQEINLSVMVMEIAERLRGLQPERQVEVVIEPDMKANGDERLIRIALENILENAWKYTSKHPTARIEFGSRSSGRNQIYYVKDDGAGFDMKYAQKLFGAFQRMHTTEEFPGTGVGLATVQRIIRRHGGKIWAESEVEKGTTFYFSISENGVDNGDSKADIAG
ncbi:MAG TPA: YfiR/HmsC family protein [Fibrobacteria bacterium]|nr:YfiR/HmsC family protein [Fibrobacteria bacterium]